MRVYNYSSKNILESDFLNGLFKDACIMKSDLDGLISEKIDWHQVTMNDTNCNDAIFNNLKLSDCSLIRSSLIKSNFNNCRFLNISFSGLSLIKSQFNNSRFENYHLDSCTLQRAIFKKSIFINSSFKDFEGLYANISNCVFINCNFTINYGSGMNGFSSGKLENCIFHNCNFIGYPLRGANSINCTFIFCTGEITDDIVAENSYGIPYVSFSNKMQLNHIEEAKNLLNEVSNAK